MPSYWFGDVKDGRCLPFAGDNEALSERVRSIAAGREPAPLPDRDLAVKCGASCSNAEYLAKLRELCFFMAEAEIRKRYAGTDTELLQMTRALDVMDTAINLLSERAVEWHQVRHPSFSRKYRRTPSHILVRSIQQKSRGALEKVAGEIGNLSATRTALAREVSARANHVMPNTSALIGGLVAARLMEQAGGLEALARLPASAIQVLGARTALFSHIRTHSPSPKHGIIFQHRRVHNAKKEVRGKVARVLAGKLAIAARLDNFRGVPVPEFIESAQARIDAAGMVVTDDPDR